MKKFIFDFDGTLVDSMDVWCATMLRILDEHKIVYDRNIIKIITPLGYKGTALYFIKEFGLKESPEELMDMMNQYCIAGYRDKVVLKNTVRETLHVLKEKGYSLNVLTASPHSALDVCLKRNEVYELFDNVWSCDDFDTTKTDPEIYKRVAQKLETTVDNCIFLDDNLNADLTAKEAGMMVIGVYDKSSDDFVEQMKLLCDDYIYEFNELCYTFSN